MVPERTHIGPKKGICAQETNRKACARYCYLCFLRMEWLASNLRILLRVVEGIEFFVGSLLTIWKLESFHSREDFMKMSSTMSLMAALKILVSQFFLVAQILNPN